MEVVEPIHQRIDYLSKIVGVIFVAVGVDRIRFGDIQTAFSYMLIGALISLTPYIINVKE